MYNGKYILSCGHEVPDMRKAYDCRTKTYDREGNPAVRFDVVCGICEENYRKHGLCLDTEEQLKNWLEQK